MEEREIWSLCCSFSPLMEKSKDFLNPFKKEETKRCFYQNYGPILVKISRRSPKGKHKALTSVTAPCVWSVCLSK